MEMKNIADVPANAGVIKKLKKRLKQLQRETGDTLLISN
jgi:hypothetical protein